MSLRTAEEQTEGLLEVMERAGKLHRINMAIQNTEPAPHVHLALTGVEHGHDVQILYLVGGYDVWIRDPESEGGWDFAQSDLTADEAAQVLADAYMYDKAALILTRDFGMSTGGVAAALEDDERAQALYAIIDGGSDKVRDGTSEERAAGIAQAIEAMVKQGGKPGVIIVPD